jgi:multifunctional beta-oxidation protein
LHGTGKSSAPADIVVQEIKNFGGCAVADYNNVIDGHLIIKTAVEKFGRIDILVNNAGILRDRSFQKMTEDEWNLVHQVHVTGAYRTTKAAWEYFLRQGYGRIIMTISAAGLYGNPGQTNYGSAKMCLYGFGKSLALEGLKRGIFCNIVAPIAGTRITGTILPQEVLDQIHPKYVAPFVSYLCSDQCHHNGDVFEVGAGFVSRVEVRANAGIRIAASLHVPLDRLGTLFDVEKLAPFKSFADFESKDALQIEGSDTPVNISGKVIVITGAAQGLGRSYTLELSKLGATCVLVDPYKDEKGVYGIQQLRDDIEKRGGRCYTVCKSVTEAEGELAQTLSTLGRVDILINNAGLTRDRTFANLPDEEWKLVMDVHLAGTMKMVKTCLKFFTGNGGKIINVSSPSALQGNYGQANYAAAKAGIWGFSNCLKLELQKRKIDVFCIAPLAYTAMTKGILTESQRSTHSPEFVARCMASCCDDRFKCPYGFLLIGGNTVRCVVLVRSAPLSTPSGNSLYEFISLSKALSSDSKYEIPANAQSSFTKFMDMQKEASKAELSLQLKPERLDPLRIIQYHLAIGFKSTDLKYVYERHANFEVFPTFSAIFSYQLFSNFEFGQVLDNFDLVSHSLLIHRSICST